MLSRDSFYVPELDVLLAVVRWLDGAVQRDGEADAESHPEPCKLLESTVKLGNAVNSSESLFSTASTSDG